ncbi:phosphoglycerate/bisphosphoglycerate mutase [Caballeronia terrestris]|uniref:Phosphoglycerate/bisphosphoglycerate mutase n=1 Tax=Caballeronia terrestris TaxID=1226301 RepID=A0A158EWY0_9BURK|nr:histidine phosphatase family protein [Caballeronia terrestris]SAL11230.1 phosphoglycerate/bisphosphoglycerate mutase [Caballeronia terrestris]
MKTELTLICHAATHAMKTGRFPTSDDPIEAVDLVAAKRQVVTSPARAARETAALFDDEAQIDHSFDDLDYGRWHGRSIRDVHDEDAAGLEAWLSDPTSAPHGGESLEALAGRIVRGLERYAHGGPHLIVTHAIALKVALARVLDAPLESVYAMDFEPLATLVLTRYGAKWRVRVPAILTSV